MPPPPPKISGTGQSYGPSYAELQAGKAKLVADEVTATWRTLMAALGQSAPAHLNRMQRATQAIRRYGG